MKVSEAIKLIESKTGKKLVLKEVNVLEHLQDNYLETKEQLVDLKKAFEGYKKFHKSFLSIVTPDIEEYLGDLYNNFEKEIKYYERQIDGLKKEIEKNK